MTKTKRIITKILAFALILICGWGLILPAFSVRARAVESTTYSNVLDDLQKDSSFNENDYPAKADDYSLDVIQISESKNGDLYIYVYQPCANEKRIVASSISISTNKDKPDFKKYSLSLVSFEGVFHKYKVLSFSISSQVQRNYSISAIYRPYDKALDGELSDDNTISEKALSVGQAWMATTLNKSTVYEMELEDVIQVTSQHIGFISYPDSRFFRYSNLDSHFVAFSTNKPMEDLLEVQLEFTTQLKVSISPGGTSLGETVLHKEVYTAEEVFESSWWVLGSYKWNRIQSVEEFLKQEGDTLVDGKENDIADKNWVVRFYESEFNVMNDYIGEGLGSYLQTTTTSNVVTDVTLLRFRYEFGGKIYNVGVVSDVQSGNESPDGVHDTSEWWEKLFALLGAILLILFLVLLGLNPISVIMFLLAVIKFIGKVLLCLIKAPFAFVGWLLRKRKRR